MQSPPSTSAPGSAGPPGTAAPCCAAGADSQWALQHAVHSTEHRQADAGNKECRAAPTSRIFLNFGIALSKHYLCFLSTHKAIALEVICISRTGVTMLP